MNLIHKIITIVFLSTLTFSSFALTELTDDEMRNVTGQAGLDISFSQNLLDQFSTSLVDWQRDGVGEFNAADMRDFILDVSQNVFGVTADEFEMRGVVYDTSGGLVVSINGQAIKVSYPTHIDSISIKNIRIDTSKIDNYAGNAINENASFGSIYISDFNMKITGNVRITVR